MKRFIFGGTTEGRMLAEQYIAAGDEVIACVTSGYGKSLLPEDATVYAGPLDEDAMRALIARHAPDELIDATHPFAEQVTRNIRACAEALRLPYRRVNREGDACSDFSGDVAWAENAEAAATMLAVGQGAALLTTGSHTLPVFTAHVAPERLFARILPTVEAITGAKSAGILPSHIIAMQGPFSQALNEALYDQLGICAMVTKDSGDIGGVRDKVIPALARDMQVIIIGRPQEGE